MFFEIFIKLRKLINYMITSVKKKKDKFCSDDRTIFVASLATQVGIGLCLVFNTITVRPTFL